MTNDLPALAPVRLLDGQMTPEEHEAWLDSPVSPLTLYYNPRTGRLAVTHREMIEALERPRHVAQSVIRWRSKGRGLSVSTVHLAIDHNWSRGYSWQGIDLAATDAPIVYETMVFGNTPQFDALIGVTDEDYGLSDFQARYCTAAEARQGHEELCTAITRALIRLRYTVVRHDPVDGLATVVDPIVDETPGPPEVVAHE